jgi:anti-anti-sigma factor
LAHLALSAARPDGITVARVIAPDHRVSATSDYGPDGRSQRLPEDLVRLSRAATGPVVLDCRGVEQIDSAGVGIILSLWKGLRVAKLPLAMCAPETVRAVFEVARLTRLIPCTADLPAAYRAVLPPGAEVAPDPPPTAESWVADPDPYHRLEVLPGSVPARKRRLFAVACGRRIGHLLGSAACRRAMEVAEAHADGGATDAELAAADAEASAAVADAEEHGRLTAATAAAGATADPDAGRAARRAAAWAGEVDGPAPQLSLVEDVFGDPFRATRFDPPWLTPAVRDLAWRIDNEADFDRMPELAAALAAAGCDDRELLAHGATPAGHVRGCWAVDLVLGR